MQEIKPGLAVEILEGFERQSEREGFQMRVMNELWREGWCAVPGLGEVVTSIGAAKQGVGNSSQAKISVQWVTGHWCKSNLRVHERNIQVSVNVVKGENNK